MMFSNKLLSVIKCLKQQRHLSALYITGDKAQKNFAVLKPVIDFDKQLENKKVLTENFKKRQLGLDIEQIEKCWTFFQDLKQRKAALEQTRAEIGQSLGRMLKNPDDHQEEIEKLKLHGKIIKDDLKHLKEYYYQIEENTMNRILDLPNILHDRTTEEPHTIYKYLEHNKEKSDSHMDIAEKLGYIKYFDSFTCYLLSDAALFEMSIQNLFRKSLLGAGYTQFSNSNFCRSIIVEGCGKTNQDVITLEELEAKEDETNHLHLCGSASLYPFMAYFARYSVNDTSFPLRMFSVGKIYNPIKADSPKNLFNLSQETVLNIFVATFDDQDIFKVITKQVSEFYERLGYHFQLVIQPASQLEKSESLRVSIQMFSNSELGYVEVGNISFHESYISKRLLFTYNFAKTRRYPKIISGTLINVPKLLGCVLENNSLSDTPLVSDALRKHLF